jgi:hypothetical protein
LSGSLGRTRPSPLEFFRDLSRAPPEDPPLFIRRGYVGADRDRLRHPRLFHGARRHDVPYHERIVSALQFRRQLQYYQARRHARVDQATRAGFVVFGLRKTPWDSFSQVEAEGYEIHHGRTAPGSGPSTATVAAYGDDHEPISWQAGPVMGWYVHGLFEKPSVMNALFGRVAPSLDSVFDGLADFIDLHFEPGVLLDLLR